MKKPRATWMQQGKFGLMAHGLAQCTPAVVSAANGVASDGALK